MRVKSIDWLDILVPPKFVKDDEWVQGDLGINQLQVQLDQAYNDKFLQILIGRSLSPACKLYETTIKNGLVQMPIENTEIQKGSWEIHLRITDGIEIIASCGLKYAIRCGADYSLVELPSVSVDYINKLIADIRVAVAEGNETKNNLQLVTNEAKQTDSSLKDSIKAADLKKTELNETGAQKVKEINLAADTRIEEIKTTQGLKGDKGEKGDIGAAGPQGIQGPIGLTGATGPRGEIGPQGEQGIQGTKGDKGDIGLTPADSTNIKDNSKFETFIGTKSEWDGFLDKIDGHNYLLHLIGQTGITTSYEKYISPFAGEQPNKHISLCFYGDSTGIRMWNNPNDPMPIKTMNNNGLQVLEETEDYTIYIDKDAVFTTVQKYVPGTYQEFSDRKSLIDSSAGLMKSYSITWSTQDSVNLINEINDKALKRLEEQPMMLSVEGEETPNEIQVLSSKAVPVTYECCFRIDKKSGEIYIGEGYENLFDSISTISSSYCEIIKQLDGEFYIKKLSDGNNSQLFLRDNNFIGMKLSTSTELLECSHPTFVFENRIFTNTRKRITSYGVLSNEAISTVDKIDDWITTYNFLDVPADTTFRFIRTTITKTSTPKPFVKSIMPSGKLDRISNANETTHTFLNKGDGVVTFGNGYFSLKGEKIQQLSVYNALLTEQEKQSELAKDIKLR